MTSTHSVPLSSTNTSRRTWLAQTSSLSLGYFITASAASAMRAADKPNSKLRFAGIGVGGKGGSDIEQAAEHGEVVAVCDISDATLEQAKSRYIHAQAFYDYRKLVSDPIFKQVDAVVVSTADHSHALAAALSMQAGKHVYVQKPLAHTVHECRWLASLAKQTGVCTQMGNQGTAVSSFRRGVEVLRSGVIGPVREIHVWTDRPIWPQAPEIQKRSATGTDPRAAGIHWDEFLGPAEMRPFVADLYTPFKWRGWWDFGTGAIGDMACHCANMVFMGLDLGYAVAVSAEHGAVTEEACPQWAKVTIDFPQRGSLPPVRLTWYEGRRDGKQVMPDDEVVRRALGENQKLQDNGSLAIGQNGALYSGHGQNTGFQVFGAAAEKVSNFDTPEQLPQPPQGASNDHAMKAEWVQAILAGKPEMCMSNFAYASRLSEAFLLGNAAIRVGKPLKFDADKIAFANEPTANHYLSKSYRKGWEIPGMKA